ncbi:MAG: diguanylate cyclase domain-containing protein, partial [Gemmatimonadota bacterium]
DEAGDLVGLLRGEQRGGSRSWTEEDRRRARQAARAALGRGDEDRGSGPEAASGSGSAAGGDRAAAEFERLAVEANAGGIGLLDPDGTVRRCNASLARAVGFESAEGLTGTNLVRARFAAERTWRGLLGRLEREDRVTDHEVEVELPGQDSPRWLLLAASLLEGDGEPARVLTTAVDVTVRKQREMRLRHQAYRDPLTGLANRRLLRETAEQTLALAERHGRTAGLLYLDLSDFKQVNDTFGHDVGDLVLVAVADRLRELVRESDLAARVGGDEFAILLPEIDDEAGALQAGRRLLEELNRPIGVAEEEVRIGGKAGIALY